MKNKPTPMSYISPNKNTLIKATAENSALGNEDNTNPSLSKKDIMINNRKNLVSNA